MTFQTVVRLLAGLLILLVSPASAQDVRPLQAQEAFRLSVERTQADQVTLKWQIESGYYLYRDHLQAKDPATGETIALQTEPGVIETGDENFGSSEVYYSQAVAHLPGDAPQRVAITYQGCQKNSICYPPMTVVLDTASLGLGEPTVGFGIAADSATSTENAESGGFRLAGDEQDGGMIGSLLARGGVSWVIASFLVFGVLLAFTPCVLPMYPILSATLAREGEALTARRGFILSSAYVLAMAAAFGMLGIVAAWSGQNLQIVLQSPYAIGAIALLFVILAMSMFGLFELQLPSAWMNRMTGVGPGRRGSVGGAAAMGFVSTLIVGPCVTAPLAAALLYIAQTGDAWLGASALFALGLGQGLPLIAFGTLGSRALPRAGAWMVQVKYVFGFVFLGAAVWMASRIFSPQITLALWAVLLLTGAVFMGAVDRLPSDALAGQRFRKAAGLALSLGGVILAVGAASGGVDPLRPLAQLGMTGAMQAGTSELRFARAASRTDLQEHLSSADGEPTLVYFTADWCVTCGAIERDVLPDPAITAGLQSFQRLKVDLSSLDATNQELMHDLAVVGPPTMIFFGGNGAEAEGSRLVGDVTRKTLLNSISLAK